VLGIDRSTGFPGKKHCVRSLRRGLAAGSVDDLQASACREVVAAVVAGLLLQAIGNVPATVRPTATMTNRLFDFALNRDVRPMFHRSRELGFPVRSLGADRHRAQPVPGVIP